MRRSNTGSLIFWEGMGIFELLFGCKLVVYFDHSTFRGRELLDIKFLARKERSKENLLEVRKYTVIVKIGLDFKFIILRSVNNSTRFLR